MRGRYASVSTVVNVIQVLQRGSSNYSPQTKPDEIEFSFLQFELVVLHKLLDFSS